jgi:multidrug efflux pump subunit AcrA (membrane-fusion protein)
VTVAAVRRRTLAVQVSGPGVTTAIQVEVVRAPFAGTLTDLLVQDGDRVVAGQVIGHVLSRESAAALEGARAMMRSATTPQARSDAERALEIAERSRVAAVLRATEAGVVAAHRASPGAIVAQEQDLLSIAVTGSIAFVAQVDQSAVSQVRPGDAASVEIPGLRAALPARVHALLPVTAAGGFTVPVRIDFTAGPPLTPGLFGTARVVVAEIPGAQVVPPAAVLRDDVTGATRLALVTARGIARWVDVETGAEEDGALQIVSPPLPDGAKVVTTGQVGLPEGARVQVQP